MQEISRNHNRGGRFVDNDKIFLSAIFFLLIFSVVYSQTSVTPVSSLQDPETIDQDDMCIWIHPDPPLSTVIASDKYATSYLSMI
jgi:hypothetical protein